jgi:putative ABC transport system substrate-binding protein
MSGGVGRRAFIALLAGAGISAAPAARAQSPQRTRKVAVLFPFAAADPEARSRLRGLRLGLRDLEWIEGRNVEMNVRFAGGAREAIEQQAAELVAWKPDVIVVFSTPVLIAVHRATSSIPIVFANVTDAVGQGIVASLAHPGGNITGFSFIEPEMVGKWINLLGDVKPGLARVALMFNPETAPFFDPYMRAFKAAQQRTSVAIEAAHVRSVDDIEAAIAELAQQPGSGLVVGSDIFMVNARASAMASADKHRVPIICPYRQWVVEGALMSYGPDTADIARRASGYVDRILKGESPGNLPVQSPFKFELVINLKTARALGLTVRDSFAELADEVIE